MTTRQHIFATLRTLMRERGEDAVLDHAARLEDKGYGQDVDVALNYL
jgi:hypothetical protein